MSPTKNILAGNPLVDIRGGTLYIDPQLRAFEDAMKYVKSNRSDVGRIYIGFDHLGIFRENFVNPKLELSGRQLKKPNLSMLLPEITSVYRPITEQYGVELADIRVMTEEQCRMTMLQLAEREPEIGSNNLMFNYSRRSCQDVGGCEISSSDIGAANMDDAPEKLRVTCKGILAEFMRRCGKNGADVQAFIEYDQRRAMLSTITTGTELAKKVLKVRGDITCVLKANKDLTIVNGEMVTPNNI